MKQKLVLEFLDRPASPCRRRAAGHGGVERFRKRWPALSLGARLIFGPERITRLSLSGSL
jgi:hypothetical protein